MNWESLAPESNVKTKERKWKVWVVPYDWLYNSFPVFINILLNLQEQHIYNILKKCLWLGICNMYCLHIAYNECLLNIKQIVSFLKI